MTPDTRPYGDLESAAGHLDVSREELRRALALYDVLENPEWVLDGHGLLEERGTA